MYASNQLILMVSLATYIGDCLRRLQAEFEYWDGAPCARSSCSRFIPVGWLSVITPVCSRRPVRRKFLRWPHSLDHTDTLTRKPRKHVPSAITNSRRHHRPRDHTLIGHRRSTSPRTQCRSTLSELCAQACQLQYAIPKCLLQWNQQWPVFENQRYLLLLMPKTPNRPHIPFSAATSKRKRTCGHQRTTEYRRIANCINNLGYQRHGPHWRVMTSAVMSLGNNDI